MVYDQTHKTRSYDNKPFIRLSVMANHRPSDLVAAARVVAGAAAELGLIAHSGGGQAAAPLAPLRRAA